MWLQVDLYSLAWSLSINYSSFANGLGLEQELGQALQKLALVACKPERVAVLV